MIEKQLEAPFDELPEALVEEMLQSCKNVGDKLSSHFKNILKKKNEIRISLEKENLLKRANELSITRSYPTSCGVDGSYAIEKLVSTDISAVASLAVEGLIPPGPEKRYWPKPRYFPYVDITKHSDNTSLILRGIMMNMELQLAFHAPHDVIFLDGSLTTPFIYFNQAINKIDNSPENIVKVFRYGKELKNEDDVKFPGIKESFEAYETILSSPKSDKIFAGIPKYTTKNEVCEKLELDKYEDRGLLNFILRGGEYIGPLALKQPEKEWHIKYLPEMGKLKEKIISHLKNLCVVYYKPSEFFPVIRIEISPSVAYNKYRLAILFEALDIQCTTPAIMEPYPLYLADRMVKHLRTALPAIRKTTTQEIALKWENELGNMYLAMHGYRTEYGR